jgi:hypothetical protein
MDSICLAASLWSLYYCSVNSLNFVKHTENKLDGFVRRRNFIECVIPAKAGIQLFQDVLDPGFRRGDGPREFLRNHQGQITLVLNLLTLGTLAHFRHSRHFGLRPCRAKFICVQIKFFQLARSSPYSSGLRSRRNAQTRRVRSISDKSIVARTTPSIAPLGWSRRSPSGEAQKLFP